MEQPNSILSFELIYVIVNYGVGSKVLHRAKEHGIPGGTVFSGKGTINNSLLNFLSLYDERKEIVLLGTDSHTVERVLPQLDEEFQFKKPHHGIVFTVSVCEAAGSRFLQPEENAKKEKRSERMYRNIITIVDRGKAEKVIDAAKEAGAKGATIINARGSGIHETMKLFNMDIEPEKEMVMVLAKEDVAEAIVSSIREKLEIDKPGKGIIFVQQVNRVLGIYE